MNRNNPKPIYYTPQDLADMFGVSRRAVYKWVTGGLLETVKVGPKLRYVTPEQLERFLAASGRTAYKGVAGPEPEPEPPKPVAPKSVAAGSLNPKPQYASIPRPTDRQKPPKGGRRR